MKKDMSAKDSKKEQPNTSSVRVRHWDYSMGEQEDGTVIDETKLYYIVVPDIDIRPTVRWSKLDCEVL